MILLAVLIMAAVSLLRGPTGIEKHAREAIEEGRLVRPPGNNLLETLEEGSTEEVSEETLARIARAADSVSTAIFEDWHDEGTAPEKGWRDVERLARLHLLADSTASPARTRLAYARAQSAFQDERYEQAVELYGDALRAGSPNDTGVRPWDLAHNGIGKSCWRMEDTRCAIEAYEAAIEANPSWVFPYLNLAGVFMEMNDDSRAETLYARAIDLDPSRASSHYLYGELLFHIGRYRAAKDAYQRAVQIDPGTASGDAREKLEWLVDRGY